MSRSSLLTLIVAAIAFIALAPADTLAQCSMCRTALEQNPEAAAGFNRAILFLLLMPYTVFGSLAGYVLVSRRRRARKVAAAVVPGIRATAIRGEVPVSEIS